ncbi:EexN family lipoprotein, partial [Pseudomonas aeruginosa]
MNKIVLILLAAMLTACDKSEPTETVAALAANPERLKELRQQCKT